jgi:hypothetical protein
VTRRAPDNLAALDPGHAPKEVAPLVASLNALFDRVRASIENERRFTADAAHELRTPLAALRAQAQVAQGADGEAERARALDNVIAGCDRARIWSISCSRSPGSNPRAFAPSVSPAISPREPASRCRDRAGGHRQVDRVDLLAHAASDRRRRRPPALDPAAQ